MAIRIIPALAPAPSLCLPILPNPEYVPPPSHIEVVYGCYSGNFYTAIGELNAFFRRK